MLRCASWYGATEKVRDMSVEERSQISDSVVAGFTEFAGGVRFEEIGETVRHSAKRSLLDSVGCALAARDVSVVRSLELLAGEVSSSRPATVFGTGITTAPDLAALVNGTMTRVLDFNDDYFGTDTSNAEGDNGPHPSDNIGGVLAAAEMTSSSGADALLGIVIAYEVCGQLVDEVLLRSNGWDYTIFHSIATAAAASRLLGLESGGIADAIRLATVANLSVHETRAGTLSNWKGMAGPNGSRNGLFAARLAQVGITGPDRAFEGEMGLMKQIGHEFRLGAFGGAQAPFRIENTYFKTLPIRYELQLPVQLALELHTSVKAADVSRIRIHMCGKTVVSRASEPGLWRPQTRETADHSGPYLIATALVHGFLDESSFEEARLRDPEVLQVVDAIELVEDPVYTKSFPWPMSCRFEVELTDGERVVVEGLDPKGHPRNPLSDDELAVKFHRQVDGRLGVSRANRLADVIWELERHESLRQLFVAMAER